MLFQFLFRIGNSLYPAAERVKEKKNAENKRKSNASKQKNEAIISSVLLTMAFKTFLSE